jgi:methionine synthase II (cobalamin-independent)
LILNGNRLKEGQAMPRGPGRILTTHAGSLPRPRSLIDIYVARSNGEAIDEAVLDAEGAAATQWVVDRQREAGVDIPSDGEQVREAFFLYLQRRMTGFGGGWDRPGQGARRQQLSTTDGDRPGDLCR